MSNYNIEKNGFEIFSPPNLEPLNLIRKDLLKFSKELFPYNGESLDEFFNQFHKHNLPETEMNTLKLKIIPYLTTNQDIKENICKLITEHAYVNLGRDLVRQKTVNLVIQTPHNLSRAEAHRDAPLNSPFELTYFIPLVDCFATKNLFCLDFDQTLSTLPMLDGENGSLSKYQEHAEKIGKTMPLKMGEVLVFMTSLIHGSHVNTESETRWSLNYRLKNLFSPYGTKGIPDFFELYQLSALSRKAFILEEKGFNSFEP